MSYFHSVIVIVFNFCCLPEQDAQFIVVLLSKGLYPPSSSRTINSKFSSAVIKLRHHRDLNSSSEFDDLIDREVERLNHPMTPVEFKKAKSRKRVRQLIAAFFCFKMGICHPFSQSPPRIPYLIPRRTATTTPNSCDCVPQMPEV